MMINRTPNDSDNVEGELRNIITTKNKSRRGLIERYEKKIKEHIVTKSKRNIKYIGIPFCRAMELMGGIKIGNVGDIYPMGDIKWLDLIAEGLEIRRGGVAAWAGKANEGLFLKKGYGIKAWTIIGIYNGRITRQEGLYVLEVEGIDGGVFRIDAEALEHGIGIYGKINEDIHGGEINVIFEDMGLIISTKDMEGPCEILTEYGKDYDWDGVKWGSFTELRGRMIEMEGWCGQALESKSMKEARKGNQLEKLMARIVDGKMDTTSLHSIIGMEREGIAAHLTSGVTSGVMGVRRKAIRGGDVTARGKED